MFFLLKRHNSENKTDAQLNSPWNKILFRISPWYWNRSRSAIVQSRLAAFVSVHLHTYSSLATVALGHFGVSAWACVCDCVCVYANQQNGITSEWLFNWYFSLTKIFNHSPTYFVILLRFFLASRCVHFYVCQSHQFRFLFATIIAIWPFVFQPFIVENWIAFYWYMSQKNDVFCILNSIRNTFGLFWMISVGERMRWTATLIFDSIKLIFVVFTWSKLWDSVKPIKLEKRVKYEPF